MLTSVVVVADTRVSAVEASLQALVPAVGEAETAGADVEIVVVDSSGRPEVTGLLRGVEGPASYVRLGATARAPSPGGSPRLVATSSGSAGPRAAPSRPPSRA